MSGVKNQKFRFFLGIIVNWVLSRNEQKCGQALPTPLPTQLNSPFS